MPDSRGKTKIIKDIRGQSKAYLIEDEIGRLQSTYHEKYIVLQRIRLLADDSYELRLGYYMIGKKPRMRGRWVWGQYTLMVPAQDFSNLIRVARRRKWV